MIRREPTRIEMSLEEDVREEYQEMENRRVLEKRKQTMSLIAEGTSSKGVMIFKQTSSGLFDSNSIQSANSAFSPIVRGTRLQIRGGAATTSNSLA